MIKLFAKHDPPLIGHVPYEFITIVNIKQLQVNYFEESF